MQDVYRTGPTQGIRATVDHADCAAPTRQHELNHTHIRNLSSLEDLDNEVGTDHTDHLSHVCRFTP